MKKVFVVLLSFTSFLATAQKINSSKVPATVAAGFKKSFPAVKDAKWEKEKGNYEANFMQNGHKMSALFDASGNWKETESSIPVSGLPAPASQYLQTHYNGKKIKEAAELKLADGSTNYEAEVGGMDMIFDTKGNFIRKQKD